MYFHVITANKSQLTVKKYLLHSYSGSLVLKQANVETSLKMKNTSAHIKILHTNQTFVVLNIRYKYLIVNLSKFDKQACIHWQSTPSEVFPLNRWEIQH